MKPKRRNFHQSNGKGLKVEIGWSPSARDSRIDERKAFHQNGTHVATIERGPSSTHTIYTCTAGSETAQFKTVHESIRWLVERVGERET